MDCTEDSPSGLRHARLDALHQLFSHRHLPYRQVQGEEKERGGHLANGILNRKNDRWGNNFYVSSLY